MTDTMKGILSVSIPNIGSVLVTTFTNLEMTLKILCLSITAGYGIWKWIHDYKLSKKKKK